MFGINKYVLIGAGALVLVGLLFFGVKRWENSIRQEAIATERLKIKDELEKDYARKLREAMQNVKETKAAIDNASDDELVEYFRSGVLPKRKGDNPKRDAD